MSTARRASADSKRLGGALLDLLHDRPRAVDRSAQIGALLRRLGRLGSRWINRRRVAWSGRRFDGIGFLHGLGNEGIWTPAAPRDIDDGDDDEESDESHARMKSTRQTKSLDELKVALVHYTDTSVIGGVEAVMSMQACELSISRWDVPVIARSEQANVILKARDPIKELRAAVRDLDVVIVHNVLTMPFDLPLTEALWQLAEEMPHIRWIAWVHDIAACNPDYDRAWHQPPWQRLTQASPHFIYVAVSEHRARQFERLTGVKARVIPNPVDVMGALGLEDPAWSYAQDHALLEREIVLIQPARLVRRKNIELGLDVIAQLRQRGRDAVTLITAADDPHNASGADYGRELRERRSQLGLEKSVLFVRDNRFLDRERLAALYALSDALFFPSRSEGFGIPILEAALHRLPVFCTDIEPMNGLLDHGVHTFAPDATPAEIATLIERTLDRSPAHRARREALRRYSWEAVRRDHLAPLLLG